MAHKKNYILTKEEGNRVLLKKFIEYKTTGWIFLLVFLGFGFLLLFINVDKTNLSLIFFKNMGGMLLIGLSLIFLIITYPLEMKLMEHKTGFLIEKTYPFVKEKKFKIDRIDKPTIFGVKPSKLSGKKINPANRVYSLKFSYKGGEINLYYYLITSGISHLNTPEEIEEIAKFFKIPFKLVEEEVKL